MKLKLLILCGCLSLLAGATNAGDVQSRVVTVTTTATNADTLVSTDLTTIKGYLESIDLDVVTAAKTASVTVVAVPALSTLANVDIIPWVRLAADATYRPTVWRTDGSGNSLQTNGAFGRYLFAGETLRVSVSNATSTSIVFRALVKWEQ